VFRLRFEPIAARETATAPFCVVERSVRGAWRLASSYWHEVEAATFGVVRVRDFDGRVELRLLGRGPALIRLGAPTVVAEPGRVSCAYPIVGGLLVGRPGGALTLEQLDSGSVLLRSTLTDYVPRRVGGLYAFVQTRIHSAVSRRHLARLIAEAA
jgi:hypothetical protein